VTAHGSPLCQAVVGSRFLALVVLELIGGGFAAGPSKGRCAVAGGAARVRGSRCASAVEEAMCSGMRGRPDNLD
jgi:hypothetical protein